MYVIIQINRHFNAYLRNGTWVGNRSEAQQFTHTEALEILDGIRNQGITNVAVVPA